MKLELCTDSLEGVRTAGKYKLDRVELCSALEVGGLTPNYGLVKACVAEKTVEIHAMLRPRTGGFVYTSDELKIIEEDLLQFAELGVDGVVFGILNKENCVAEENRKLVELAKRHNIEATFHRAFDTIDNKSKAIQELIKMGFTRILTSGGALKAIDGLTVISDLQQKFGNQIQLLVGSGVNAQNALIFKEAGVSQLHFTSRTSIQTSDPFSFGKSYEIDHDKIKELQLCLQK